MRFWVAKTAEREIGRAISVGGSGSDDVAAAAAAEATVSFLGGAAFLMLLKSRWPSLVMRLDWSAE